MRLLSKKSGIGIRKTAAGDTQSLPQTGDTTPVAVMAIGMLLGVMCIAALLLYKKHKRTE